MHAVRGALVLTLATVLFVGSTLVVLPGPVEAAPVVIFSEDFESGMIDPTWPRYDGNPASGLDYWNISSQRRFTGNYSAWSAQEGNQSSGGQPNSVALRYDDDMQADMVIALSVGGFTNLTFEFYYWSRAESGGGDFLQVLSMENAIETLLFENRGTANWAFASVSVSPSAESLIVRFKTDAANHNFEGAYVDDLVLIGDESAAPTSSVLTLPLFSNLAAYPIPFTAQDGANESGIDYVELWFRLGAGAFALFTTGANPTGQWSASPVPFDASPGGDGPYEFYTIAVDLAANVEAAPASPDASMTFDTVNPTLSIASPTPGAWFATADVTVDWSGSDALSGIDRYETSLDSGAFVSQGPAVTQTFLGLSPGMHTVDVRAFDRAGNFDTQGVTFGVDLEAPAVSITAPPAATWLGTVDVTVTWSGSDALSGLDHFESNLDGAGFVSQGLSTSQTFLGLTEGAHVVDIRAHDVAGNTAIASASFSVDVSIPSLSITAPAPSAWFNVGSVSVAWAGSDALSGIDRYETSLDGGSYVSQGTSTSQTFGALADGLHTVDVHAYDVAGNVETGAVTFGVDRVDPTASFSSPGANEWLPSSTVVVSWSGADALSGMSRFETSLDGGAYVTNGLSTSRSFPGLADGTHTLDLQAYDAAGNLLTITLTFGVDTTVPAVSTTSPAGGDWLATSSVAVAWQGSDTPSGVSHYETSIDDGAFIPQGTLLDQTFGSLTEGTHTVDVRIVDLAGNTATTSLSFGVDTVAPTVTVDAPSEGRLIHVKGVTVQWTGFDATSGIDHYEVWVDSGDPESTIAPELAYPSLADGTHSVHIRAVDLAGNTQEAVVSFRVNTNAFSWDGPFGPFPLLLLGILPAAFLLALFLFRRRKKDEEDETPSEEPSPGEPPVEPLEENLEVPDGFAEELDSLESDLDDLLKR